MEPATEKFVINEMEADIDSIRPNTWNPKDSVDENAQNRERLDTIKRMMTEHGQMAVIVVRENDDGQSKYEIVDGFHRWSAAKELGWKRVRINNIGVVQNDVARALTIMFERAKVETNPTKEAQLISEMYKLLPSFDELSKILPYSPEIIKNKVELVNFDWEQFGKDGGKEGEESDHMFRFAFKVDPEAADLCNKALSIAGDDKDLGFIEVCRYYEEMHRSEEAEQDM